MILSTYYLRAYLATHLWVAFFFFFFFFLAMYEDADLFLKLYKSTFFYETKVFFPLFYLDKKNL